MKNIFYLLISIIFVQSSCFTHRNNAYDTTYQSNKKVEENKVRNYFANDSTLNLHCGKYNQVIPIKKIDWVHFKPELADCLAEEGFHGNQNANEQIALIIQVTGTLPHAVFDPRSKFRGPEVFKAFLSLDRDYSIIEHIDTETDNVDMSVVDAQSNLRYLAIMLESIYGMSWKDFTADLINYEYKTPQHLPNGKENKHRFAEEIKVMLEAIDQAWAEGKIVLKPYGVK